MRLSIPMRVEELTKNRARCSALGQVRWVDRTLMTGKSLTVGDYVIVNLGFVQRRISNEDAMKSYALFSELQSVMDKSESSS